MPTLVNPRHQPIRNCPECGKSARGRWQITKLRPYPPSHWHIECWLRSKKEQQIKIPSDLSGFYLQWNQQRVFGQLEDMRRITKLLFPDLIMPRSQRYEMGIENIDKMTIEQLQRELWSRDVPAHGKKEDLQQRLRDYMNGERCLADDCGCKISADWLIDIPSCYLAKRLEARKRRSEYISFGFCRRMERRHIPSDPTEKSSQKVTKTLQQEMNIISMHVPWVLKRIIFKYYDMIMY